MDYYNILGVEKTASDAEIKKAYKKMAIKYHPDRNPGDKEAEKKFKDAAQAYDVLRDPQKRSRYDQFGEAGVNGSGGFNGGSAQNMNMDDIFSMFGDIFGDRSGFGGFNHFNGGRSGSNQPRQSRGSDLRVKVKLSLEEINKGVTKKFKVRKNITCQHCHGTGSEGGGATDNCPTCHGSGYVTRTQQSFFGAMQTQAECPTCHGEGTIIKNKCKYCGGEGIISGEEIVEISIPAGIAEGMVLNVPNKGNAARHNGINGDIQLIVEELPHKDFIRDENDIIYNLLLSIPQAVLGEMVEIPTLDGKVRVKIEPGTQPGKVLKLRNKGLPSVQGYGMGHGDIVVNISIYTPEHPNIKDKELFEKLRESECTRPNPSVKNKIFKKFRSYFD